MKSTLKQFLHNKSFRVIFQRSKNKIPLDWCWDTNTTSWRLCAKVTLTCHKAKAEVWLLKLLCTAVSLSAKPGRSRPKSVTLLVTLVFSQQHLCGRSKKVSAELSVNSSRQSRDVQRCFFWDSGKHLTYFLEMEENSLYNYFFGMLAFFCWHLASVFHRWSEKSLRGRYRGIELFQILVLLDLVGPATTV